MCGLLLLGGFLLRALGLGTPGLFVDEGGHILAPVDDDVRRVVAPLAEGKPGMAWLFAPAHWFGLNPLVSARLISVAIGMGTALALGACLHAIAGWPAALIGTAAWMVLPFAVFHERWALLDPAVGLFTALGLAVMARSARAESRANDFRLRFALAGLVAGLAVLVKVSALILAPALAICAWTLRPRLDRTTGAAVALYLLPAGLLLACASGLAQRLPGLHVGAAQEVGPILAWLWGYGGWPLGLLLALAAWTVWRGNIPRRPAVGFALAAAVSLLLAQLIYPLPYARYLHAEHVILIAALALALAGSRSRVVATLAAVAGAAWLWFDLAVARDPGCAPLPAAERVQYLTGPWSGDGVASALARVQSERNAVLLVRRYSRSVSYAAVLEARRHPELTVVPLTLESPAGFAAARAVAVRARTLLGPDARLLVLAEGDPPTEPVFLAQAGIEFRVLWRHEKREGGRIELLECAF